MWDAATGAEVSTLKGHTGEVTCVAFSPDGKRIVSGSVDRTVKVWDADTGVAVGSLKAHTERVSSVAYSPDGLRVFAWDVAGNVRAWSTTDGTASDPRDPPALPPPGPAHSADGSFQPQPHSLLVALCDLRPLRAERQRYHGQQADLAQKEQQWFAVAFHVGRLLLDDPDNTDLKKRRAEALQKHAAP